MLKDRPEEDPADVLRHPRIHVPYLFLAFPIIAMQLLLDLPTVDAQPYFPLKSTVMFLVPAIFSCIAILLVFACANMISRNRDALASHRTLLLPGVLLMFIGCISLFSDGLEPFGLTIASPVAGTLVGLGGGMMLLFWAKAYSRLEPLEMLLNIAVSFFIAMAIGVVLCMLPPSFNSTAFAIICVILSAVPLELIFSSGPSPETFDSRIRPLSEVLPGFWKPFAGAMLCLMIVGCSWGTSLSTENFSGRSASHLVEYLSLMFAALVILVITIAFRRNESALNSFLHATPVTAAALLLLSWFLALIDKQALSLASDVTVAIAQGALYICTWYSLCTVAARGERDVFTLVGFTAAAALTVTLGCIVLGSYLVEAAQYVTPIFTVIYLVAVNFDFGRKPKPDAVAQPDDSSHDDDEQQMEQILDTVAQTYHLSPREREILPYLAKGLSVGYIADTLCVSLNTVKTHTRRVYEKLGIHTRDALIALIDANR